MRGALALNTVERPAEHSPDELVTKLGSDCEFDPFALLISARHFCFEMGVSTRHPLDDYRAAFRLLNRAYVQLRDTLKPLPNRGKRPAKPRTPGNGLVHEENNA